MDDSHYSLKPCPDSPNCVSSVATEESQKVMPFPLLGTRKDSLERLHQIILALDGTTIVAKTDFYLHAEFRSGFFGFIDDVEFLADADKEGIDVRSASRSGYYDFGANRGRVEEILEKYSETAKL